MTSAVDNCRNSIDEGVVTHTTVNVLFEVINLVPATNVVALETLGPAEHTGNPLDHTHTNEKDRQIIEVCTIHGKKHRLSKPMSNDLRMEDLMK